MTTVYVLDPVDTLLFRDGRPFEQSDEGLVEALSMFPPFPTVTAGAFRASMARGLGWDGQEKWENVPYGNGNVTKLLGSGPFDAGELHFGPPLPLRRHVTRGSGGELYSWYLPCPAALFGHFPEPGDEEWQPNKPNDRPTGLAVARPSGRDEFRASPLSSREKVSRPTRLASDKDGTPICVTREAEFKPLDGWFISLSGLELFLSGETAGSDSLMPKSDVRKAQRRVGIQREFGGKVVKEGMLYTASQVRLGGHSGTSQATEFTLGMSVRASNFAALPEPQESLQLGSVGRSVTCSSRNPEQFTNEWNGSGFIVDREAMSIDEDGCVRYSVVLVSPAWFGEDENGTRHHLTGEHGLPGELVSAVVPKPVTFGGWDARNNAPAPMRRYFAPGSTFYFKAAGDTNNVYEKLKRIAEQGVGCHTQVGLGAVAIGTWRFAEAGERK